MKNGKLKDKILIEKYGVIREHWTIGGLDWEVNIQAKKTNSYRFTELLSNYLLFI